MSVKKIVNISALLQKIGVVLLLSFLFVGMGFAQLRKLTPAQEEKLRLKTHCDYFLKVMAEPASGRKLGFIAQEIGREINTIGSKANDAGIQKLVVQMKDELEKIKEQLLNVL